MTMYETRPIPPASEPDLLDELAKWADLLFEIALLFETDQRLFERTADSPSPPAQPGVDKPSALIAAERAVLHLETMEQRQTNLCASSARCKHHRCRRRKRCRVLEEMAPAMAASRANLAAERGKWHPPVPQADPPRGRKKGRTGVRP
jgi:hypothetical protein